VELNMKQYEQLLKPLPRADIGKDGKGFAHVEAWNMRRLMNGIFGFTNWSATTDSMELIFESEGNGARWTVAYRAQVTVYVNGSTYTEWAVGDSQNQPNRADCHDMAIKTAESQAFKRCCVNLGDQFGLFLYDDGGFDKSTGAAKQSLKGTLDVWVPEVTE